MSFITSVPKWLAVPAVAIVLLLASESPGAAQNGDEYAGLPEGKGREEVAVYCSACHSLSLVAQQRLPRHSWEKLLVWMKEEQGMAELPPEDRELILDYLSEHLGRPKSRRKF